MLTSWARGALVFLLAIVAVSTPVQLARAEARPSSEDNLFALTNQDRTSNGLSALGLSGTLRSVAQDEPGNCAGVAINGRSRDMIDRNYFDHHIQGCGEYVWQAFNVGPYTAAGENIGWNNYPPCSTGASPCSETQINDAFMASQEHRTNILGDYNLLGVGAWAATGTWYGPSGAKDNVIMYTEVFIKSSSAPAPTAAPALPPPPPVARPGLGQAPAPSNAAPTPSPAATPSPGAETAPPSASPTPAQHGIEVLGADREVSRQSLLESIVEGVLRLFLSV